MIENTERGSSVYEVKIIESIEVNPVVECKYYEKQCKTKAEFSNYEAVLEFLSKEVPIGETEEVHVIKSYVPF